MGKAIKATNMLSSLANALSLLLDAGYYITSVSLVVSYFRCKVSLQIPSEKNLSSMFRWVFAGQAYRGGFPLHQVQPHIATKGEKQASFADK